MELAQALTWAKFDVEKLYMSLWYKVSAKIQKEKKQQVYRYEGTARIKDRDSDYNFERGFTL
jgi:hypothetical protein